MQPARKAKSTKSSCREGAVKPNGAKIKELRRGKGWNLADLADRVGCSTRTISSLEEGKCCFPFTLFSVADVFKVDAENLLAQETPADYEPPKERRVVLEITARFLFDKLDQTDELTEWWTDIVTKISAKHPFEILRVKEGSVKVLVDLDIDDATNLLSQYIRSGEVVFKKIMSISIHKPDHQGTLGFQLDEIDNLLERVLNIPVEEHVRRRWKRA